MFMRVQYTKAHIFREQVVTQHIFIPGIAEAGTIKVVKKNKVGTGRVGKMALVWY
jgi:hypothetical protein